MSSRTGILPVRNAPYADVDLSDAEFQRAVGRFLAVKDQTFAVSGSIAIPDTDPTTLFFRTTTGISHALPFPLKPDALNQLPALNVLLAACEPDLEEDGLDVAKGSKYDPPLVWPSDLPFSTTFDLASHPVLDTVKMVLLNKLYPGTYLYAVRDKFEVFLAGSKAGPRQDVPNPARTRDGSHLVANIVITLPVPHRGGALVVRSSGGGEERFYPTNQGKPGDKTLHWTAYLADCEHEIEFVEQGCRMTISYGVYMKSFGPAGPRPEPLLSPNEKLLGTLSALVRLSQDRTLGVYLTGKYDCSPADVLADSLVPHLRGSDATLYHALKAFKLAIELRWVALGHVWPADRTVQLKTDDLETMPSLMRHNISFTYGAPSKSSIHKASRQRRRSVAGSVASYDGSSSISGFSNKVSVPRGGHYSSRFGYRGASYEDEEDEEEYLDDIVVEGGAVPLQETNIIVLAPRDESVFRTYVPAMSKGELESVQVNVLLLFYVE